METIVDFKIPKKKLKSLLKNGAKSAQFINLVYVSDKMPGINRAKKGKKFIYHKKGKEVHGEKLLLRIKKLVIPPAWESVWICELENGHLQATGIDTRNRKQYRYHTYWNQFRNQTKFSHLLDFGKQLPAIRRHLENDLSLPGLPLEKVLAAVLMIMQETNIRVGNNMYEKLYGSFGLTTLKDKHVKINGASVQFSFKGKKGVYHEIDLNSKKLAKVIKQCRDIPGRELFQYYDKLGDRKTIDSGMVNDYLKKICNDEFTTKDFRTWMGTVHAIDELRQLGPCKTVAEGKGNVIAILDRVSKRLGNTRAVCKKYYVHPAILEMYVDNKIEKFLEPGKNDPGDNFTASEGILMNILRAS